MVIVIKLEEKELHSKVKKNLLDLEYSKYLQYYNTSIIVAFTYVIGLIVGYFTTGINKNNNALYLLAFISIAVLGFIFILLRNFKSQM